MGRAAMSGLRAATAVGKSADVPTEEAVSLSNPARELPVEYTVFLCERTREPIWVSVEPEEYEEKMCPCGAALVPLTVIPKEADHA